MITLFNYYRSTASYRVRIALHLKQIAYECIEINLIESGGQQHTPEYHQINPQHLVPALKVGDHIITQSMAILEYLEETTPCPALLPTETIAKAKVRALALNIIADIHPLNNLRVLQTLRKQFNAEESEITQWYHNWMRLGFDAIETQLQTLPRENPVCYGDEITMADICLIPQVYNAKRYHFSLENYPLICAINEYCLKQEAFRKAAPYP